MATIKQLEKELAKKNSFIKNYLKGFDKDIVKLQKELVTAILNEYATKFKTDKNGNLILSESNARLLITQLNDVFDKFQQTFSNDVFKKTGEAMLSLTGLTSDYFRQMNFSEKTIDNIQSKLAVLSRLIGINQQGNIIKDSFLDKLAKTEQTKSTISDYTRKSLEGQVSFEQFTDGLKDIVNGTNETDGALTKYVRSYVHDAMYTHSQAVSNFFAEELGLTHFLYQGDEIETSRQFCIERHGKYFTRKDGEKWNDQCWPGKILGYSFFDARGGYNCRHSLMWVTETAYKLGEKAGELTDLSDKCKK